MARASGTMRPSETKAPDREGWPGDHAPGPSAHRRRPRWAVPVAIAVLVAMLAFATVQAVHLNHRVASLSEQINREEAASAHLRAEVDRMQRLYSTTEHLPGSKLVAVARRSVVTVAVGPSIGSGFAVRVPRLPAGYRTAVLTAAHVVRPALEGGSSVFVISGATDQRARIADWSDEHDLALLYVSAYIPPLPIAPEGSIEAGDVVVAIGSPYLLAGTVTEGIISHVGERIIQTDVPVNPGNSGGPLVNARGQAVGVVISKIAGGEGLGFAVPVHVACAEFQTCG